MKTLVVGGWYRMRDGVAHVPENCWRMVRMFSDCLSEPVFGRIRFDSSDDRLFSTPFPESAPLVAIGDSLRRRPWERAFPDLAWSPKRYARLVSQVDAVYCRLPSWESVHIYKAALKSGKVVFGSLHGDWAEVYRLLAKKGNPLLSPLYRRLALAAHEAQVLVSKTSRVLFCVGGALSRKYGGLARDCVEFANYLHEESDLFWRSDTCRHKPFRALFVGELGSRKGVDLFLEAIRLLRDSGIPVEAVLVGEGPEKQSLSRLAKDIGRDAVKFLGYIPFGEELFETYRRSDLFVLPSMAGEGLPKVIVEAMSQGLPVVATDVGSVSHVLAESESGLLATPGNALALKEAIQRLIENGGLRRRMILNGLRFAQRMTQSAQRRTVATALERHLPGLVGTPAYLGEIEVDSRA